MDNPSFGARGRNRAPLHLVSSRDTKGRYPYRSALPHRLPRTPQGRANRREWWLTRIVIPALMIVGVVLLFVSR